MKNAAASEMQGTGGGGWGCKLQPQPLAGGEPGARSPQSPLSEFLYRENGATASCLLQGAPTALTTGFWACPQQEKGAMSPRQARNCLSRMCFHKRKEICITSKNNRASVGRERTGKPADPSLKGHRSPGGDSRVSLDFSCLTHGSGVTMTQVL